VIYLNKINKFNFIKIIIISMRPLSSSSTAASYVKNGSYPKLVSVNSKVSIYKSDGTGRDTYIEKNNGGFAYTSETPFRAFSSRKYIIFH
jgi:hypothetical protein